MYNANNESRVNVIHQILLPIIANVVIVAFFYARIIYTQAMGELASAGGNVFWVAPSGGRDRPDESGEFVVAPFDLKAIDMFKLVGMQSGKPMHFFPMAMYTHTLVPPPKEVSSTLGETRSAKRGAVSIDILDETDGMGGLKDKVFAADLQKRVEEAYRGLVEWHKSHQ
jgi:hypothetical protein